MSSTGRGRPVGFTRGVGSGFAEPAGGVGPPRPGAFAEAAATGATTASEAAGSAGALAEGDGANEVAATEGTVDGEGACTDAADAVESGTGASEW